MVSLGPHVTYTVNSSTGVLTHSQIATSTLSATNMASGGLISFRKPHPAPAYCGRRRGGPRSRVFCEVFKHVPHDIHCGRSPKGVWYTWKEDDDAS